MSLNKTCRTIKKKYLTFTLLTNKTSLENEQFHIHSFFLYNAMYLTIYVKSVLKPTYEYVYQGLTDLSSSILLNDDLLVLKFQWNNSYQYTNQRLMKCEMVFKVNHATKPTSKHRSNEVFTVYIYVNFIDAGARRFVKAMFLDRRVMTDWINNFLYQFSSLCRQ